MDNKEYSLQDIKDFMSYLCKKNKAYCIDRQNYILKCVEEKQERDNMRCENCKDWTPSCSSSDNFSYGFCEKLYERYTEDCESNFDSDTCGNDFCSYFEPKDKE